MVKQVILDCEKLVERKEAHLYLAEVFDFPEYYGKNLDALYDCLTELGTCTVLLKGEEILRQNGGYGARVLKVLEEATQMNLNLKLETGESLTVEPERINEEQ